MILNLSSSPRPKTRKSMADSQYKLIIKKFSPLGSAREEISKVLIETTWGTLLVAQYVKSV